MDITETLSKLPALINPDVLPNGDIRLFVGGLALATIKVQTEKSVSIPWLEYVLPEEASTAISYLGYDLHTRSVFVVYKKATRFYEYHDVAFEDFAEAITATSIGSSIYQLVRGKRFTHIDSPLQLLNRLKGVIVEE
jgi:hypothetical protein